MIWQLQDAKNRFSEVVDLALSKGPQAITRHGKKTAVLISEEDFRKMKTHNTNLADFFSAAPHANLNVERSKDLGRSVEL